MGDYEDSWFIECDLASQAPTTIQGKGERYLDCFQTGAVQQAEGVFPRTAWITPDASRARVVREALARLPKEARQLFAVTTSDEAVALLSAGGRP